MSRTVFRNASFSAAQTVVSAFLLFFLYRYLLQTLGAEQLGIWAVVLASTSVARLSDMGLSGAALRFVAKNLAAGKTEQAAEVVQTASISIGAVLAILLMLAYPVLKLILASVIPPDSMPKAISILPWAMLSLWFGLVAGIFQSALDGCSRMDLRNIILIFCNLLYLVGAFWLVPNYGLEGLAKGQFAQTVALVLLSWFTLRKQLPSMPWAPCVWKRNVFKEMFGYALNFQIAGLAAMLFDPFIKFLIAKFGGLSDVAFYEMANQVILKVRGVLISAYQAIVPTIAGIVESDTKTLANLYRKSYRILSFIAVPYFLGVCIALPLISLLWIGHIEVKFITFGGLLCAGWMLSSIGVPAYFHNIGTGTLRWNTATHLLTLALLLPFAFVFGGSFGGFAVVASAMISLFIPNYILASVLQKKLDITYGEVFSVENRWLFFWAVIGAIASLVFYGGGGNKINSLGVCALAFAIYALIVVVAIYNHPYFDTYIKKLNKNG